MCCDEEVLNVMGMTWHECMYGVMCMKALEISEELTTANLKVIALQAHIDILNKLKEQENVEQK